MGGECYSCPLRRSAAHGSVKLPGPMEGAAESVSWWLHHLTARQTTRRCYGVDLLQGDKGWFGRARAQVVWDPHADGDAAVAAAAAAIARPELAGKRVALFGWSESVSPGDLAVTKDPLLGGTTPPTLPSLSTYTLHSGSRMYMHPCAYSHNMPRRLKEGENGASTLHRTKIKNSFTLKLREKMFQNHMHRLRKKKKGENSRFLEANVLISSTFFPLPGSLLLPK